MYLQVQISASAIIKDQKSGLATNAKNNKRSRQQLNGDGGANLRRSLDIFDEISINQNRLGTKS